MGRKVHPLGFRIGIIRDWQAKWYADKHYPEFIQEDVKVRKAIRSRYSEAGISLVEIERQANRVTITIYTSRPGIVIGRGGQRVDETRHYLEEIIDKRVQLNIQEIRQPELDAYLVAKMVAEQMERRIAYRRAMKQALFRTMQAGAKGMRIICSGRLGGVEIARRQMMHQGRVPLHTLRADIDYGFTEAHTTLGLIGIKVWIYRGDILPEVEEMVQEIVLEPVAERKDTAVTEEKPEEKVEKKITAKKKVTRKKSTEEEKSKEEKPEEKIEKKVTAKKKVTRKKSTEEEKSKEEKPEEKIEKKVTAKKKVTKAAEKKGANKPKEKKVTKEGKSKKKETGKKVTEKKMVKSTSNTTIEELS